jgi:hypothetical protein
MRTLPTTPSVPLLDAGASRHGEGAGVAASPATTERDPGVAGQGGAHEPLAASGGVAWGAPGAWAGSSDLAAVDAAEAELVRRLVHLRTILTRYVRARRTTGAPVDRVLVEVRDLVRIATAGERWPDPDGALVAQSLQWALATFHDRASHPPHAEPEGTRVAPLVS